MGSGTGIECMNCHYLFDARTGVGMMYSRLSNVLDQIHYTRRPIIESILNNHDVQDTEYEHRVYRCSKCGRFGERFYIKIVYDQDQVYETQFKCSKCNGPLDDVSNEDLTKYPCPKCNQKTFILVSMLNWD